MDEQGEIIARMNRWADYRWQPPANPPRRDPRLAALWDPWRAVLENVTEADWAALCTAYVADPGWLDAYNEAVALGVSAGRAGDVAAARSANPGTGLAMSAPTMNRGSRATPSCWLWSLRTCSQQTCVSASSRRGGRPSGRPRSPGDCPALTPAREWGIWLYLRLGCGPIVGGRRDIEVI